MTITTLCGAYRFSPHAPRGQVWTVERRVYGQRYVSAGDIRSASACPRALLIAAQRAGLA